MRPLLILYTTPIHIHTEIVIQMTENELKKRIQELEESSSETTARLEELLRKQKQNKRASSTRR